MKCLNAMMILPLLFATTCTFAQQQFGVVGTTRNIAGGFTEYRYTVTNGKGSAADIVSVGANKTNGAGISERFFRGSGNRGWDFITSPTGFGWDHSTPLSLFGQDIGPGETREFVAMSASAPMLGDFTAFYGAGGKPVQMTQNNVQVPDTKQVALHTWTNTPGGGGIFDVGTGAWDYGFELTAIETVDVAILDFDSEVDLKNITINRPGWNLLHVGFDSDDPSLPGDRSGLDLAGLAILYATSSGSPLLPGQTIDLTLSSSFSPGSVFSPNGNMVSGPRPADVPEPSCVMLVSSGILFVFASLRRRYNPSETLQG